ncbi:hypothetical protein QPK87_34670 [Kamptonema cortianum]|nr:hypothetical protein [Kamptonema cortianum]
MSSVSAVWQYTCDLQNVLAQARDSASFCWFDLQEEHPAHRYCVYGQIAVIVV